MAMSNHPPKKIPFIILAITVTLFFVPALSFCKEPELSAMQKQAREYRNMGFQLQQEEKLEEAAAYYQKAMLLDPSYAVVYNDMGVIYESLGYPDQALQMYLKSVELDPNYPNTYTNLALLYEDQKDYPSAIICWLRRALLGGAEDPWAQTARKRLSAIANSYPEAFRDIGEQYKANLQQLAQGEPALKEHAYLKHEETKVTLFEDEKTAAAQPQDNRARAVHYLRSARESFYRGDYVTALKEATVAGYLDPSSQEISAFVDKVRKTLLQ